MPDLRLIVGVVLVVALLGAFYAADRNAYRRGEARATARYETRDAEAARVAATRIHELEEQARAAEQASAKRLAAVSADYQRKLTDAANENDRIRRALASGELRLRLPAVQSTDSAGSARSEAATGACGRDDTASGELPRTIALDLWQLAADADAVAEQLAACQAVIRAEP